MKKLLSIILALTMLLSSSMLVSADDGSGKKDVGEHEHQLMKMANAACHYEECTICFELFNVGDHTFKDGKCTVCGHSELVNPFVDVRPDAWYHDEIVEAVRTGIINGKTPTTFKPDDFLTYAEAAKLAACMNQVYTNGKVTLTNGTPWYKPYVDYCKEKGIITKEYEFGRNATRAGYMEIFANALPEEAFKQINNIPDGSILDVKSGATYAHFVYKMYRAGIVTGVDEKHSCNPEATIKRCEVATIISRMMNDNNRVEFEMTGNSDKDEEPKEEAKIEEPGKDNQKAEKWDDPTNIPPENPEVTNKVPTQEVTPDITVLPTVPVDIEKPVINSELTIHKQPEGAEYDAYGKKHELEVQVYGGKAPYTYEWYYYTGNRNTKAKIENGDYAKDADTAALVLSVEKDNPLLGRAIFCTIKDSSGTSVTTNNVKIYGPFSMPVDSYSIVTAAKTYQFVGRVADGILRKGEKVSLIRNDKVIAIGVAKDLQMFNKSLDETCKGDNVGIVFDKEEGAVPSVGDIVVKYQPMHVVDTSDIIN